MKFIILYFRLSKTSPVKRDCFLLFQSFKEHYPTSRGFSGANRDRTDNLRLARAALSQLSYSPKTPREVMGLRLLQKKRTTQPIMWA
jgi:hypothetical protein